jgi:hypothetical protein
MTFAPSDGDAFEGRVLADTSVFSMWLGDRPPSEDRRKARLGVCSRGWDNR